MSRALAISLGAIIGLSLGVVAKSLIQKVDAKSQPSTNLLLATSCAVGIIVSELIFLRFSEIELRVCYAILCAGLLVQSLIDAYTRRLVRQISNVMAVSGILLLSFYAVRNSYVESFVSAGVCAIFGVVFSFVTNKISRGSLGAGDVRLMAVLGWHLGFLSISVAMWALFASCVYASVFGLALRMHHRGSWQQRIAFGPFLALGTVTAIFFDEVSSYSLIA